MSNRMSAFLIQSLVAVTMPLRALAQPTQQPGIPSAPYDWPGPWHMWGNGWPFWWVCLLMMLLVLLVLLVCGVMFFARRSCCPGRRRQDPDRSALQILSERLAKGEIGMDEYAEKKSAILAGGGAR